MISWHRAWRFAKLYVVVLALFSIVLAVQTHRNDKPTPASPTIYVPAMSGSRDEPIEVPVVLRGCKDRPEMCEWPDLPEPWDDPQEWPR